jgi:hypothetical protein
MAFLIPQVHGRVHLLALAAVAAGGILLPSAPSVDGQSKVSEAQAMAGFLYNLVLFVDWPASALDGQTSIVVGVAGSTSIVRELGAFDGRVVRGRSIRVRQVLEGEDPTGCHVLFVPADAEREGALLLSKIRGKPVLTVGDDEGFLASGGVVRVFVEAARMRFEIDLANAERSHLRLSSKLLGLATRVVRGSHVVSR